MRSALILVNCLLLVFGCQTARKASQSDLALFERALQLTISPDRTSLTSGETFRLNLRLTNLTDQKVKTCLGITRGATFWGLDAPYAKGTGFQVVDHPYCVQSISLEAGASHEWSEEFIAPELPPGRARLFGSVQLVSTKNCDEYGCDTTSLRGVFEPVIIVSPSN